MSRDETDINLHNIGFTKLGQSSDHQALRNVVSLNVSQNKLKVLVLCVPLVFVDVLLMSARAHNRACC